MILTYFKTITNNGNNEYVCYPQELPLHTFRNPVLLPFPTPVSGNHLSVLYQISVDFLELYMNGITHYVCSSFLSIDPDFHLVSFSLCLNFL